MCGGDPRIQGVSAGHRDESRRGTHECAMPLRVCHEITYSFAANRFLTVAALKAQRSRDREGAVGSVISERPLSPISGNAAEFVGQVFNLRPGGTPNRPADQCANAAPAG